MPLQTLSRETERPTQLCAAARRMFRHRKNADGEPEKGFGNHAEFVVPFERQMPRKQRPLIDAGERASGNGSRRLGGATPAMGPVARCRICSAPCWRRGERLINVHAGGHPAMGHCEPEGARHMRGRNIVSARGVDRRWVCRQPYEQRQAAGKSLPASVGRQKAYQTSGRHVPGGTYLQGRRNHPMTKIS